MDLDWTPFSWRAPARPPAPAKVSEAEHPTKAFEVCSRVLILRKSFPADSPSPDAKTRKSRSRNCSENGRADKKNGASKEGHARRRAKQRSGLEDSGFGVFRGLGDLGFRGLGI